MVQEVVNSGVTGVFYYFNSALNPILYSLLSKRFRRGLVDLRASLAQSRACTQAERQAREIMG